jgi:hypothetical protein
MEPYNQNTCNGCIELYRCSHRVCLKCWNHICSTGKKCPLCRTYNAFKV